jgi:hypothetical protein
VITPLAPAIIGVADAPDDMPDEPPPHAARIVAAASAAELAAIKILRFIALTPCLDAGKKLSTIQADTDKRKLPAGGLIPSKEH